MPCSLYLSLPEVSHFTPTNSPISHGSTHVVDAFRIFSESPNHPATSAVIGLLTLVQMFQTLLPKLQVYSVRLGLTANQLWCQIQRQSWGSNRGLVILCLRLQCWQYTCQNVCYCAVENKTVNTANIKACELILLMKSVWGLSSI